MNKIQNYLLVIILLSQIYPQQKSNSRIKLTSFSIGYLDKSKVANYFIDDEGD